MSKLVRFDPFAEMDALQRHFFNDDNWMPRQMRSVGLPTTDVYMKDNALVVEVHLPKFVKTTSIFLSKTATWLSKPNGTKKKKIKKRSTSYASRAAASTAVFSCQSALTPMLLKHTWTTAS